MSKIGYYRIKTLADVDQTVNFYVNGSAVASKEIVLIDSCPGDVRIKFLDRNGQYRFWAFTKCYQSTDYPEKIGGVSKFLTNILNNQSDKSNVGYRSQRIISATTECTAEQLEMLQDIYTSPRIYMYVGTSGDSLSDWLEVEIQANEAIARRRKTLSGAITFDIVLPERYNITMI